MAKLFDKVLNFVGWEIDEEDEEEVVEEQEEVKEEVRQPQFLQNNMNSSKKQQGKVVNIHQSNQMKVVIVQPENYDDAQEICDHLKNRKPIIINLEEIEKEPAQRIIDFLSGSVYALEGTIQKVANGIFLIAPHNVDVMGDFKDELRNKSGFSWLK